MFDWLFEGAVAVYIVLALLAVILLILWWQRRDRRLLVALGVVALAALSWYLLDVLVETDRERALRTVDDIVAAINQSDLNRAFTLIADDFAAYGRNKQDLRREAEDYKDRIRNVTIKDKALLSYDREKGTAKLECRVFADMNMGYRTPVRCEIDLVRGRDGKQWWVKGFTLFQPGIDSTEIWNPFSR